MKQVNYTQDNSSFQGKKSCPGWDSQQLDTQMHYYYVSHNTLYGAEIGQIFNRLLNVVFVPIQQTQCLE